MAKKYIITVNGTKYEVVVEDANPNVAYTPVAAPAAPAAPVAAPANAPAPVEAPAAAPAPAAVPAGGEKITAPLPGTVLKVVAKAGQAVKAGDVLCVIEAMKMENDIVSPVDGTVASVSANEGSTVNSGDLLFVIG